MKAQVVSTRYPQIDANGDRHRRVRGEVIDVTKEEFDRGVALGALREPSDVALPEANLAATIADGTAAPITEPDGTPLDLPGADTPDDFKKPRTHIEADALAASLNVTFPDGTKLGDKVEALQQVAAARAAGEPALDAPVSREDISELSDAELIQRGIDFGRSEDEMTEMGHDELVLFVAETMNQAGNTEAQQQRSLAERTE